MKISDAVYTAAVFLQLDGVCDYMSSEEFDPNGYKEDAGEDVRTEIDLLLRCCNLVLGELSEGDFPLKAKEKFTVTDGCIRYDDFDRKVTDIYKVEAGGKNIPFGTYYDRITLPIEGECTVTYSFAPDNAALSDLSPYKGNKPSARLTAYGIAREYCLISGMLDDAVMWSSRFDSCAQTEAACRTYKSVLPRRWR